MRDLIVIGAGPVGLMTAWRAARAGAAVTLLDDGRAPAGHVAAGMLGPWSEAEHRDGAMHTLMVRAARLWPSCAGELAEDSRREVGFVPSGTLLVAGRPEQIAPLRRHGETVATLDEAPEWRTGSTLRALEPGLGPDVAGGFAMTEEHQVDPRQALSALKDACRGLGVELRDERAVAVRGTHVSTDAPEEIAAGHVVLAAGWSAGALAGDVPLRPVKGQILRLASGDDGPPVARVVRSADAYIAPRPDGEVVIGGTVEEAGDTRVTAGAVQQLLEEAARLVPDIRELELREAAAALRPATPDGLPAIGRGREPGVLWAAGAFRHGILLSPLIAAEIVAIAGGADPDAVFGSFSPERFAEAA